MDYVDEPLTKWRINGLAEKPWKKSLVSRAEELKSSLEELVNAHPDVKAKYPAELQSFYKILEYELGVAAWRKGHHAEAGVTLPTTCPAGNSPSSTYALILCQASFFTG